ncbi:glyoxalase [Gryllotalpicola protaetiae]|uniref:Glyoxalase n=1 Tax=Gryllotalpicola protaetiae TaxID=2419771 RepID=A0A387BUC8_9MICO|nr:glyoxalase [Gryllotalpicola protaetiae]
MSPLSHRSEHKGLGSYDRWFGDPGLARYYFDRPLSNGGIVTRLQRVVISVSDLDRAVSFYRDLLGLPGTVGDGKAILSGARNVELLLHERETVPSDLSVALSFGVGELETVCSAWLAAGGIVVDAPADQPWGERMAVVRDPDGHLVCLTADHA